MPKSIPLYFLKNPIFDRSASVLEEEDGVCSKAGSLDRNRNSFENPLAPAGFGGDPEAAEYNRPSVL